MEITKALSEYLVNLKFSDLPSDVVEGAKLCFLDWLGVTLSGSKEPLTGILLQLAETQGGAPQATVIGKKKKTSLLQAALINGSASHALDFKVPETCTTSLYLNSLDTQLPSHYTPNTKKRVPIRKAAKRYALRPEMSSTTLPPMIFPCLLPTLRDVPTGPPCFHSPTCSIIQPLTPPNFAATSILDLSSGQHTAGIAKLRTLRGRCGIKMLHTTCWSPFTG